MAKGFQRRLWIVRLITQAPESAPDTNPKDKRPARLADLLAQTYGASAITADSAVEVHIPIAEVDPIHDADEAAYQAQELVRDALRQLELAGWEVGPGVAVEMPDVLGAQEVAAVLGITRQRVHELRQAGRFPEPLVELAAGPIWLGTVVDGFALGNRRSGRPETRCSGELVLHFDGSRSCTVCTVSRRHPDVVAHSQRHACYGCPVCMAP